MGYLTNFLRVLEPELFDFNGKTEMYRTSKTVEEDGTYVLKTPFKGDGRLKTSFDKESGLFTWSVFEKTENGSSASLESMTIPKKYRAHEPTQRLNEKDGTVEFVFYQKETEMCEAKEESTKDKLVTIQDKMSELNDELMSLDDKLEELNEQMHDAIDEEDFKKIASLSEEFGETKGRYNMVKIELDKLKEDLHNMYSEECCCEKRGEKGRCACGSKKEWKRDSKGRFVK